MWHEGMSVRNKGNGRTSVHVKNNAPAARNGGTYTNGYMKGHGCTGIHTNGMSANGERNGGANEYDPTTCFMFAQDTSMFVVS